MNAQDEVIGDYTLFLTKCELKGNTLVERGEYFPLSINEAIQRLAPSGMPGAKFNVLKVKTGAYIGIWNRNGQIKNFIIHNPTDDGNITWLLDKLPELGASLIEVYLVNDISKPKKARDLHE